jgi:hypothetical protein
MDIARTDESTIMKKIVSTTTYKANGIAFTVRTVRFTAAAGDTFRARRDFTTSDYARFLTDPVTNPTVTPGKRRFRP